MLVTSSLSRKTAIGGTDPLMDERPLAREWRLRVTTLDWRCSPEAAQGDLLGELGGDRGPPAQRRETRRFTYRVAGILAGGPY